MSTPIKVDLGVNHTQPRMLKGGVFAVFCSLSSIPFARLANKANRATMISVAVGFWSAMTALGDAAGSFWSLLTARIGEAGCGLPKDSLVSR